ncbi:calcium-translocating P-type ATPase, SERCA-type [Virgibacillus sp. MSP4-1]|uniref:calcium-translocating P-type ATPase, SERCA-type n=1 Tax=Virgibacillus sp. MSP4-1 TaxID=2700081 RepID=UPI00039DCDC7|nr:calcium-translocating P-type ATPase, SERCA-type [Virgibacillus sp. MSP4-1]QHS22191.1 calcium-translocating P-type ATPase, SERCA-type [Virgibacillus sp. MSP4-1]
MKWYTKNQKQIEAYLQTNAGHGLSEKQAQERLRQHGANEIAEQDTVSRIYLFVQQFKDFMVLVLLGATLISGLLGEYIDAIAIMAIVLLNGLLGYFQEQKAEKSMAKLKELSAPVATVLQDGVWVNKTSREIVPGDIVKVKTGERISADLRLLDVNGLEIEESVLTGESIPAVKNEEPIPNENVELGDQHNMAFSGTLVTRGSGRGVVVATGMSTAMGQIASMLSSTERLPTPLERKLEELGKILIVGAILLTIAVALLGIYQGHPIYHMFLAGVSLAVAAIPEGLPAIVTVALSLGVQRMIKRKAVVRKLSAVETLGSASVVCSDKTGTLTQNQMTVQQIYVPKQHYFVTGKGYHPKGKFYLNRKKVDPLSTSALSQLLKNTLLCSHAEILKTIGRVQIDGDPTEGALVVAAEKAGLSRQNLHGIKVIHEIPFDSARKLMTVVVEDEKGKRFVISKGAPDVLLKRTSWIQEGSERRPFTPKREKHIHHMMERMTNEALRTIAVCVKELDPSENAKDFQLENHLTFTGLFGLMDPPREEAAEAIETCRQAGVKTVMITGDHVNTGQAVARQLNLLPPHGKVLDGYQLSQMSDEELEAIIPEVYVFARVSPEHKLRIVKAFQNRGHVVAMTGDGVNDAPAIKASDIGISMGKGGTDVTKEASSLILMDDHFATIKSAIEEGRNIYENIRKFIRYLLASNVGEILVMLFAMMLAMPLPLVPVQILWVNLVTDGLPALALGLDQPEKDVMKRPPRSQKESVFARGLGFKIVSRGFLIGLVTLIAFIFAYQKSPDHLAYAQTVAFVTLVMAQLIHVFDCRSDYSVFSRNPLGNLYLAGAVISSILLLLAVIYFEPLQPIFHTVELPLTEWVYILALSAIPTFIWMPSGKEKNHSIHG